MKNFIAKNLQAPLVTLTGAALLWSCSGTVSTDTLGLTSARFAISQNATNGNLVKINTTDSTTRLKVRCQKEVTKLAASFDNGASWADLASVNCDESEEVWVKTARLDGFKGAEDILTNNAVYPFLVKGASETFDTVPVELVAVKPVFANVSAQPNPNTSKTRFLFIDVSTPVQQNFPALPSEASVPYEVAYGSSGNCSNLGEWRLFTSPFYGVPIPLMNSLNLVDARFRDEAHNASACTTFNIENDLIPPTVLGSPTINGGVDLAKTNVITVTDHSTLGAERILIFFNSGCAGTPAYDLSYLDNSSSHTIDLGAQQGQRAISLRYSDDVGNLSTCSNTNLTLDSSPPSNLTLSAKDYSITTLTAELVIGGLDLAKIGLKVGSCPTGLSDGTWINYVNEVDFALPMNGVHQVFVRGADSNDNLSDGTTNCPSVTVTAEDPNLLALTFNITNDVVSSRTIALEMAANAATKMRFASVTDNTLCGSVTTWQEQSYSTTANYTLPDEQGLHTVYVQFGKDDGSWTAGCLSDTVRYDNLQPNAPTIILTAGGTTTNKRTNTFTITTNEPGAYRIVEGSSCSDLNTQEWILSGSETRNPTLTLTAAQGSKNIFAEVRDLAGLVSNCSSLQVTMDTSPPSLTAFAIESGTQLTKNPNPLAVSISHSSDVSHISFSSNETCTPSNWQAIGSYVVPNLNEGPQTQYAKVKDPAGNESLCVGDSIVIDRNAPQIQSVMINGNAATSSTRLLSVAISTTDNDVKRYKLGPNNDCSGTSWLSWSGESSVAWNATTDGSIALYAQLEDMAGNLSTCGGVTGSDSIVVDSAPPQLASYDINNGAGSTGSRSITLDTTLIPGDSATHALVYLGSNNCSVSPIEIPYSTSISTNLPNTVANNVQYFISIRLKDSAGNISISCQSDYLTFSEDDNIAPDITIGDGSGFTKSSNITISFIGHNISNYQVEEPGQSLVNQPNSSSSWSSGFTLSTGEGSKNINFQFTRNSSTLSSSGTILLDETPPSNPTVEITNAVLVEGLAYVKDSTLQLSVTNVSDSLSGVQKVVFTQGSGEETQRVNNFGIPLTINPTNGFKSLSVKAVDKAGNESSSPAVLNFILDTSIPTKPQLSSNLSANGQDDMITLSLDPPATLGSDERVIVYLMNSADVAAQATNIHASPWGGPLNFSHYLINGGTYYYRARIEDKAGNLSELSDLVSYTFENQPPMVTDVRLSTPLADSSLGYTSSDGSLTIAVKYNKTLTRVGVPQLNVQVTDGWQNSVVELVSQSVTLTNDGNGAILSFVFAEIPRHLMSAALETTASISLPAGATLKHGSIDADLALPQGNSENSSLESKAIKVNYTPVIAKTLPAKGNYRTSDFLSFGFVIDQPVQVSKILGLTRQFKIGNSNKSASCGLTSPLSGTKIIKGAYTTQFSCAYLILGSDTGTDITDVGFAIANGNGIENAISGNAEITSGNTTYNEIVVNQPEQMLEFSNPTPLLASTSVTATFSLNQPPLNTISVLIDQAINGLWNRVESSLNGISAIKAINTYGNQTNFEILQLASGINTSVTQQSTPLLESTTILWRPPRGNNTNDFLKNISVGRAHSCGIGRNDQRVYCWGDNSVGQLGDGTLTSRTEPRPVYGSLQFSQLSVGHDNTCAVTIGDNLYCWGRGQFYKNGDGTNTNRNTPTQVMRSTHISNPNSSISAITEVKFVKVGRYLVCAGFGTNHQVVCWGDESDTSGIEPASTNSITNGNNNDDNGIRPWTAKPVVNVTGVTSPEHLAVGELIMCAYIVSNRIRCWGAPNSLVRGGTSRTISVPQDTTIEIAFSIGTSLTTNLAGLNVQSLHAAKDTLCVRFQNSAQCVGSNENGALGGTVTNNGSNINTSFANIISSVNHNTFCGVTADGLIRCWGNQPTKGFFSTRTTANGNQFSSPSLLANKAYWGQAITRSGDISMGGASNGEPVICYNLDTDLSNQASSEQTFCTTNGSSLLAGLMQPFLNTPAVAGKMVPLGSGNREIDDPSKFIFKASALMSCSYYETSTGADATNVNCTRRHDYSSHWPGTNFLGDGTSGNNLRQVATRVRLPGFVHSLDVGGGLACAVVGTKKALWCWGDYSSSATTLNLRYPTWILENVRTFAISYQTLSGYRPATVCGFTEDNHSFCFGDNSLGQFGAGNNNSYAFVFNTAATTEITDQIVGGEGFFCKRNSATSPLDPSKVKCVGLGANGRLGTGGTANATTWATVNGEYQFIAAGSNFACGIRTDSQVSCWGVNTHGQSIPSASNTNNVLSPTILTNSSNTTELSLGRAHACLRKSNNTSFCWGDHSTGARAVASPSTTPSTSFTAQLISNGGSAINDIERIQLGWNSSCFIYQSGTSNLRRVHCSGQRDPSLFSVIPEIYGSPLNHSNP